MDYAKKIAELEQELARVKKLKEEDDALNPAERLAEYLHSQLCHHNHIDQCGWEYSSWDRPDGTRERYLEKANSMLKVADYNTIIKIIKLL